MSCLPHRPAMRSLPAWPGHFRDVLVNRLNMNDLGLPDELRTVLHQFVGPAEAAEVAAQLRPADACMDPVSLSAFKSTRLSFARVLARRMIRERWKIANAYFDCDDNGDARALYRIDLDGHRLTYIVRAYPWDGVEKIGRRADGVNRDMFGALFFGEPDEARIEQEFAVFDTRDIGRMRTDSGLVGWTPANRSMRLFDHVVDCLAAGRQPEPRMLSEGTGYLMRNAGFIGSGRSGTVSYDGIPDDHPLKHPYFADLFGLYLIRQVSIDLVNAIARARSGSAVALAPELARYVGIGNSSGQGMCVAVQRWPQWVASWVVVRELALAYARSRPVEDGPGRTLVKLLSRTAAFYDAVKLQSEEFVTPPHMIAAELRDFRSWVEEALTGRRGTWSPLLDRAARTLDRETAEQIHSLLIEAYPDFADAVADYLPVGARVPRRIEPQMTVATLLEQIRAQYGWALATSLAGPDARKHFWYHSIDFGEQRRGDRGIDPHEEFESFIDVIGAIQRLAAALLSYPDDSPVAEVIADQPALAFEIARVQTLAGLPYAEIRGNLGGAAFAPAYAIRFMLAVLGMECTNPLSIRYVRGVFFQGMPLADDLAGATDAFWPFPPEPVLQPREFA